jgi:hypothetical protein
MKKQLLSRKRLLPLFYSLCLILCINVGWGQTVTQTFNASTFWTCPTGVTSITVECWGGGGSGGAGAASRSGGGGGGGSYVTNTLTVVPGLNYTLTVGAGGLAGSTGNSGNYGLKGNNTIFSSGTGTVAVPINANGGAPGGGGNSATPSGSGAVLGGVYGFTVPVQGTGYAVDNSTVVNFSGGGGIGAVGKVASTAGPITVVSAASQGSGYTSVPTITFTGTGTGASVSALVALFTGNTGGTVTLGGNGIDGVAGASGGAGGPGGGPGGGAGGISNTVSGGIGAVGQTPGGGSAGGFGAVGSAKGGSGGVGQIKISYTAPLINYYYKGGDLHTQANWSNTADLSGTPPLNFTADFQIFHIGSSTTTTAPWAVSGAASKIIVGDVASPAVTLTIASGFDVTGTIDIPAASSGSNSVVMNNIVAPTFGILDINSEVHFQLSAPILTATTFGKVFFENSYSPGVNVPIIIQKLLSLASTATLAMNSNSYFYFNTGATATIAGTLKTNRATGFFGFNILPASAGILNPVLQFQDVENVGTSLVLTGSTIEYNRASSGATQFINSRIDYNNLTILGTGNVKTFQGITAVSGKLTIDIDTSVTTALTSLTPVTILASGSLKVTSGTFNTGGFLTLKSSECCTATVGALGIIGVISGDVVAERNIPIGHRAYRLLSPATTGGTINANWQEGGLVTTVGGISNPNLTYGTHITGAGGIANGFDTTTNNASSIFTYDNASPAWTALANTNGTLTAGSPYLVYIRGGRLVTNIDASLGNDATTLRTTGTLTTGTVAVSGLNETANGFSIVGNPYQAQVDMNKVLVTNATAVNLTSYYYVVDPKLGGKGAYATVDLVTPGNSSAVDANQYLQPGQACFVQTVAASAASLNFTEADKFEGTQTSVFRTKNVATARLLLTLNDATSTALDRLVVAFDSNETNDVNQNDASKLTNFDESMATSNSSKLLAIEKRAIPTDIDEIPLNITKYRGTSYTIKAEGTGLTGSTPYLFDKYTSTTTEIPQDGSVNYAYTVDANIPASIAADRFKLIYAKTLKTIDNAVSGFALYPNPSKSNSFSVSVPQIMNKASLTVSNMLGQKLYLQNDLQSGTTVKVSVSNVKTSGIYLVSLTSEGKTATTKWIVE